jgi:hydrogenase maturation protein HypF
MATGVEPQSTADPGGRSILVRGIVQGVGFRPHVHGLASRLGLRGFVQNQRHGVRIEIEGAPGALDQFVAALTREPPPLARIDEIDCICREARSEAGFRIEPSQEVAAGGRILLSPDAATCAQCLRELFDPADRRHRYPFINCTDCGPRLTIIRAAPYDRERTTMAGFRMCAPCQAEYDDVRSRRFHAQPNACPDCGPRLALHDAAGNALGSDEPLGAAVAALRRGEIVAIKGLGGYHLACDATSGTAVGALRRRKHREERPLAVMVADLEAAALLCEVSPEERALLAGPERPIVLLMRRHAAAVAPAVSPFNPLLGVMLPYTPLHHLLARMMDGIPLVMTSGNRSQEPIAFDDADALERLRGIADLFLVHDRPVHLRCDDSVVRALGGEGTVLRRSRGYAPASLELPAPCERPTLALGGHLKAAFALGHGRCALLSPHLGDLEDRRASQAYVETIAHYERLFAVEPILLVHDLHPDYASTAYARDRASAQGLPRLAVQHHHAHMASCLAEHGLTAPAIGVTFDGTGYGGDGTLWGGEFLIGGCRSFRRAAHLRSVPLPGGEAAIREPWRMALSHLIDGEHGDWADDLMGTRIPRVAMRTVGRMIERRVQSPSCSSMGRLFDAVAALAGVRDRTTFEGQAAMELEWLAAEAPRDGSYPFALTADLDPIVVDTRPLIGALASDCRQGVPPPRVARRFHETVVDIIEAVCSALRRTSGLDLVVLSGGVFQNGLLSAAATARLSEAGFRVYRHRRVPPNDGGLAFGQLAVAAAAGEAGSRPGSR